MLWAVCHSIILNFADECQRQSNQIKGEGHGEQQERETNCHRRSVVLEKIVHT